MSKKLDWEYINSILEGADAIAAPKTTKPKLPKENRAVTRFIKDNDIRPGQNKVPNLVIFYYFRTWCRKAGFSSKIGLTEFFRHFKKYFDQVRDGRSRYYLVNEALVLNDEVLEKAQKHRNMYNGLTRSYRDREKKEKQSKVSSVKEGTESEIS